MGKTDAFMRKPDGANARKAALAALLRDAKKDPTSLACIPDGLVCRARITANSPLVLCGVAEAGEIFRSMGVRTSWKFREGQRVGRGKEICALSGNARGILACERTALNYLSLLSGIATKSARASEKHGKRRICATRKTLPGLADSEKRAVALGGCLTHRMGLSDGILVKDNHVAAIIKSGAARNPAEAITVALGRFGSSDFVEVEVSSLREAVAAARGGAPAILADNVKPAKLSEIVRAARKENPRIIIEASGGITVANAGKYLRAGADFASTGELTMKIEPANLSLEILPE